MHEENPSFTEHPPKQEKHPVDQFSKNVHEHKAKMIQQILENFRPLKGFLP
jgi:hypothetical protein